MKGKVLTPSQLMKPSKEDENLYPKMRDSVNAYKFIESQFIRSCQQ
ncbi:hypothetical protein [Sulfurisphaera ohwakuensis]